MPDSPSAGPIRVAIVDDHALLTESLVRLIGEDPAVLVVGTAGSASAGIDLAVRERADVVLMDYSLPDMDGASATRLLRDASPEVAVIMITGSERQGAYSAAMEAGCAAWVRKTRALQDLLDAIHRVAAGDRVPTTEYEELPDLRELVVHYQPVLQLTDRRVVGFEALVRWQHPREGLLPPSRFLPLAEETGHIVDIGWHVTRQALRDLRAWQREAPSEPPLWVAVNLSAVGIAVPHLAQQVGEVVAAAGTDPADLVFELTETALLDDTPLIAENMRALKAVGVRLALDDFGTAFSSLSYLRRFPFDHVKIDTSFTAELPDTTRAVLLVESIQQLGEQPGRDGRRRGHRTPGAGRVSRQDGLGTGPGLPLQPRRAVRAGVCPRPRPRAARMMTPPRLAARARGIQDGRLRAP